MRAVPGVRSEASGAASAVSGGDFNEAIGQYSSVVGGVFADASGYGSTIVSGYGNVTGTSGTYAVAVSGQNNQANHGASVVLGGNKVVTTASFQILPSSH